MVKEIIMHKIPVTLVMLMRKAKIFIHIKCHYVGKRNFACLIFTDELPVYSYWAGTCRKAQDKRSVQGKRSVQD